LYREILFHNSTIELVLIHKLSSEALLGPVGNTGISYQRADDRDGATDSIAKRPWILMMTGAQVLVAFKGNKDNFAGEKLSSSPSRISNKIPMTIRKETALRTHVGTGVRLWRML
jgi:hypothetical protein